MGQYYKAVNLDRQEYLSSYDYDSGAKLMEHSWLLNPMLIAAMHLLAPGGRWHKTRLVWAGDYADEKAYLDGFSNVYYVDERGVNHVHNVYSYAKKHFEKINDQYEYNPSLRYIINHTKKQYVDLAKCPMIDGWMIHPLSLLTASGNGRGGGDYRGHNKHLVGLWAGDVISSDSKVPQGYEEITPDFREEW